MKHVKMEPDRQGEKPGKRPAEEHAIAATWDSARPRTEPRPEGRARAWEPNVAGAPRPPDKKEILKSRARALAREPVSRGSSSKCIELVEFLLAHERYAIESTRVKEVYPLKELTPVPCTPPFVLGIVNVRGQIVTVIDLRRFFDLPIKGITDLNKVIILQSDDMQIGILADLILGIRSLPLDELQPPLPTLTGIRSEFLRGVSNDRLVVLDAAKILADEKVMVREEVEA